MKKNILIFLEIALAFICSITVVSATTGQVVKGDFTGSAYYWPDVTQNVHSDILGYAPKWKTVPLYRVDPDGSTHGNFMLMMNGKPVYCIEPGILVSYDNIEYNNNYQYDGEKHARIHSEDMAWISYFGYLSPADGIDHSDVSYYDATQNLVWQTVYPGFRTIYFTNDNDKDNSDTYKVAEKSQEILELIAKAKEKPVINQPSSVTVGQTITFAGDYSKLNVVLSSNKDATIISKDKNGLKIRFNTLNSVKITVSKIFNGANDISSVVYTSSSSQDVMSLGLKLPTVSSSITVTPKGSNISLKKISSRISGFMGNATLKGAVYLVKYTGDVNYPDFELTTDENGNATTKGTNNDGKLPLGTYTIKEIHPSTGYKLDTKTYTIKITADNSTLIQSITSTEQIIEAKIQIVKVEANDKTGILVPEPNKVFKLYPTFGNNQNTEIATLTTDKDGYATVSGIPYGKYVLKQVEPYGTSEPVTPINIEINEKNDGTTLKYVLANAPYKAKVRIVKRDKDTDKVIESVGFKFKIKMLKDENDEDVNEYITQTITLATGKKKKIEYFETDTDGTVITPESLKPGLYQIEEISTAEGYLKSDKPLKFLISPQSVGIELEEDYGAVLTVDFYNEKIVEEPEPNPSTFDGIVFVAFGIIVTASIVFVAYKKVND